MCGHVRPLKSLCGNHCIAWRVSLLRSDTNLLVSSIDQGRDLAETLADHNVALMRGHGFAAASRSLIEVVRMSVYLPRNARALLGARLLGGDIKSLSEGEIAARNDSAYGPYSTATWRAWEYWANKCGCGGRLTSPPGKN